MAHTDQLQLVHKAICCGVLGHIQWKDSAARLVRSNRDSGGLTPEGIRGLLRQYVLDGNALVSRQETRAEYLEDNPDDPYWYRAVIPVAGLLHGLFIEVKLVDDDPEAPWVEIVSAHPQPS
jgi:hypothetical protein